MRWIATSALALVVLGTPALAGTYHVATNGDDTANGSQAAPWRTTQHAADRVAAGDTVIVHAGTYAGFTVEAQGTEAQPIVFVANGEVVIDGSQTTDRDAILIDGGAWITIDGFRVTQARRAGIAALECSHITIVHNKTDANARWGIFSGFCDDLVVDGNEASRSGTEHGIYASNSADRPIIRNNKIWGNAMCGVHLNGDVSYGGDGVISGAIIENNIISDNGRSGGSAINGDGITGAVIRNNVLDGNHASGISLYREDGGAPSTGNKVINNTVRMAADGRSAVNIQNGSGGNTVRNNILIHPNVAKGGIDACPECLAGLVADHNAGGGAAAIPATEADLFVAGSLALREGSPAIDAGDPTGAPATDVTGTTRPQGAAIDVGAYEYCAGECTGGGSGGGPTDDPGDPYSGPPETPPDDADQMAGAGGCGVAHPSGGILIGFALLGVRRRQGRLLR